MLRYGQREVGNTSGIRLPTSRISAAERMRLTRQRRREGFRVIPFEVRDSEIDQLVRHGLLKSADRNNRESIARALGTLLDGIPVALWSAAIRR